MWHNDLFRRKLLLFKNYIKNNILHFYPYCQILFKEHGTTLKKHLYLIESLIEQFDMRLVDFIMLRTNLIIFENPLTAQIKDQSLDLRAELCHLQCDLSLKTQLEKGVNFFKF